MAITHTSTLLQWTGPADTDSIGAGGSETSLEFNIDDTCIAAQIQFKADNSTTPAADDIIYFWLLQTTGDPDGASTDEFDTTGHGLLICVIDTNTEDPGIKTVEIPVVSKGFKIYAEGITEGSTNAITVSGRVLEQRSA